MRAGSRASRSGRASLAILLGLAVTILVAAAWLPGSPAPRSSLVAGPSELERLDMKEPLELARADADPAQRPTSSPVAARRDATPAAASTLLLLSLRDESGALYAGTWRVDWYHLRSAAGASSGTTDGSGSFVRIDVREPGPYSVNVRAPGDARANVGSERLAATEVVAARFDASEPPAPITLHPTGWLTGSVVDQNGVPMEGIGVWFHPRAGASELQRMGSRVPAAFSSTKTDENGRFAFDLGAARAGQIRVGAELNPWVPPIVFDALPANRQLDLDPIRLELFAATFVVQGADRSALADARIEGTGLEGGRFATTTDADGRARIEQMPRGRWRVLAQHAEHGRANRAVEIPLAKDEPVVLTLPR